MRRKDAMDELAHQIQLMQRSLDNALSERDAHVADARASKDEMVTLHAQYEKACSEIRELKVRAIAIISFL